MKLSKDQLQELIAKLQADFEKHMANANATKGAIQAYQHLLSIPDEEAPEAVEEEEQVHCLEDCAA